MSSFHNVSFPFALAFGASGGPMRQTHITSLASGAEHRNTSHAQSRRRYNAGAGIKSLDELHDLIAFFETRFGQLYSFRFRDPLDFKSGRPGHALSATDQIIATGDGQTTSFQLIKTYADAEGTYSRPITKPAADTLRLAMDGTEILPVNYTLDPLTGRVTFAAAPPTGSVITAGFEFDVPVRFDIDQLDLSLEAFGAGRAVNIPLIEVLDHA